MRARFGSIAVVGLVLGCLPACAATQNVRAYRAFAHEDASLAVSVDRIEDLSATLDLVDRVLTKTPYSPGMAWVQKLPLGNEEASRLKAQLREKAPYDDAEYEVPVLKIYRVHLERTLEENAPDADHAEHPSIVDALSSIADGADLKGHLQAERDALGALADANAEYDEVEKKATADSNGKYSPMNPLATKPPELVEAQAKVDAAKAAVAQTLEKLEKDRRAIAAAAGRRDNAKIAKDGLSVLSVCLRVELEALALVPIVTIQTVRSLGHAKDELLAKPASSRLGTVKQLTELPGYVSNVKESLTRESELLERMSDSLAHARNVDLDSTAGFELKESAVDQIVGVTLDSLRVDLRAGGEMFYYSAIGNKNESQQQSQSGGATYDYTGRTTVMQYAVKPIVLADAKLQLVLDWVQIPGAASLSFGYATDRAFRSGGDLQNTSLASQLGVKGSASDVLELGLGVLGVRSSARVATFTAGEVGLVDANNPSNVIDRAPLQFAFTQIDVGYDIAFALGDAPIKAYLEELVVGFRYFDYRLPRVLYEMENTAPAGADQKTFVFRRESPAQQVESKYYMGGFVGRFGAGEGPDWSPFADIGAYVGGGPTSFYFLTDPTAGDTPDNREIHSASAIAANISLCGGVRWRLVPRTSRIRLDLAGMYRAEMIYATVKTANSDSGAEREVNFGATDVFHGPMLQLRGSL